MNRRVGLVKIEGFTLIEIMLVVAIIGLLAAIAIPDLMRSREAAQKSVCISNLKQIQTAVEVWATNENKNVGEKPAIDSLVPDYIKNWPSCGRESYEIPSVSYNPVCPNETEGHAL